MQRTLALAGMDGSVHAREIGGPGQLELNADQTVPSASTFKVLVLLEFAC